MRMLRKGRWKLVMDMQGRGQLYDLEADPYEITNLAPDPAYGEILREMAARYGYVFYITPGPAPMTNTAYWGPPIRAGIPQRALSVNMGPETNVEREVALRVAVPRGSRWMTTFRKLPTIRPSRKTSTEALAPGLIWRS